DSLDGFVTFNWRTTLYDRDRSEFKCCYFDSHQARSIEGMSSHIATYNNFLVLGWTKDAIDRVALQIAAAAYAAAVDGKVFLPELGIFSPSEIITDIKKDDRYKTIPRKGGTQNFPKYS